MNAIQGLHHVTAMTGDAARNIDFYVRVLGQRLVKTTVNFDDPGTYHLYFGDRIGTPGTVMTFFPWPHAIRGRLGRGETSAVHYAVPPGSLGYWTEHLRGLGHEFAREPDAFGEAALTLRDPDGIELRLVESELNGSIEVWERGPVPGQHALRGFQGVSLLLSSIEPTARVLEDRLGYRSAGEEGSRFRFRAPGALAPLVDLLLDPDAPSGAFGAGSIHHIAFRTIDDAEQSEYRRDLLQHGLPVTPVQDRHYFRSIYFREPGGVLFEVATHAPGFLIDEDVEELGSRLKLPPHFEPARAEIEARLPPLERPSSG